MARLLSRLLAEETGQDLVEYGLLCSFIGFACIAVFNTLLNAISTAYSSWESGTYNLWEPDDPSGS